MFSILDGEKKGCVVQCFAAGGTGEGVNHYNDGFLGHFLAFNSKPTISIWKILGTHLSSCVIKQREGANYE